MHEKTTYFLWKDISINIWFCHKSFYSPTATLLYCPTNVTHQICLLNGGSHISVLKDTCLVCPLLYIIFLCKKSLQMLNNTMPLGRRMISLFQFHKRWIKYIPKCLWRVWFIGLNEVPEAYTVYANISKFNYTT